MGEAGEWAKMAGAPFCPGDKVHVRFESYTFPP